MEDINKIIEKNIWDFTRSPGDGHFTFVIVDMYIFIVIAFL